MAKGATWNRGIVCLGDRKIYEFDLLPEPDHRRPAFINLQQYYFEARMIERAAELPAVGLRWQHQVVGLSPRPDSVTIKVATPEGRYDVEADWVLACDGVRSLCRRLLGHEFEGRVFRDRFLIADIRLPSRQPAVRRFWFSPPFHPGQSTLMHKQADDVWRVDFQLGWNADPGRETDPRAVTQRLQNMLGDGASFEVVWSSVYTFACRRMDRFRHGRVFFLGDAAHVVSPYGARGGNSGIQDADNLVWKLDLVIAGLAPEQLLVSYEGERIAAADENIRHSTRSTEFLTPKSGASRAFRDAVLELARDHEFARPFVNSGRLSTPTAYASSPLNTPERDGFAGAMIPGAPCADAPVTVKGKPDWLLKNLGGRFTLLLFADRAPPKRVAQASKSLSPPIEIVRIGKGGRLTDVNGVAAARYDAQTGTCYLIRPDQHVAARWREIDIEALTAALDRAMGRRLVAADADIVGALL